MSRRYWSGIACNRLWACILKMLGNPINKAMFRDCEITDMRPTVGGGWIIVLDPKVKP